MMIVCAIVFAFVSTSAIAANVNSVANTAVHGNFVIQELSNGNIAVTPLDAKKKKKTKFKVCSHMCNDGTVVYCSVPKGSKCSCTESDCPPPGNGPIILTPSGGLPTNTMP